MKVSNEHILPIVVDKNPSSEPTKDFFSAMLSSVWPTATFVPLTWMSYTRDKNTSRSSEGKFITAENLRKFLLPYKSLINDVEQFSEIKLTIFHDFFAQLENHKDLTITLKELHLAKVVVLLQLLADPNLSSSPIPFPRDFLWATFHGEQWGLDVLNLLFSYGLDYAKFEYNLSTFKREIYAPILNISSENEYTRVYELLNAAYSYYKNTDYAEAARCYEEASELLNKFASQTGLSKTLRDDYLLRFQKSIEYHDICKALLSKKNEPTTTNDHPRAWNFWSQNRRCTYDAEQSCYDPLLKKNN